MRTPYGAIGVIFLAAGIYLWCTYMAVRSSGDANEFWRAKACQGYAWLDTSNGC